MHTTAMRRVGVQVVRPLFSRGSSRATHLPCGRIMRRELWVGGQAAASNGRCVRAVPVSLRIRERAVPASVGKPTIAWARRHFSAGLPEHDVVGLPALSPTMEAGTISEWKVKEGEAFSAGDIICMVETDKATVDYEAQDEAVLAKILVQAGTADVPVGTPIMVLVENAEDAAAFKDYVAEGGAASSASSAPVAEAAPTPAPAPAPAAAPSPPSQPPAPAVSAPSAYTGDRVVASPLAKHLAQQEGYNLSAIIGTGPGGRIIAADVREYVPAMADATAQAIAPAQAPATAAAAVGRASPTGEFTDYPLSEEALTIAQQLVASKQNVPHYYLTVDLRLGKLEGIRETLNGSLPEDEQLSLNDLLLKAAAIASEKVPDVNASWMDTFVRQYNSFDVNVMVGVGDGLVAPVVRNVGGRGLKSVSDDVRDLARRAQTQELEPHQVESGTFTVTNLGAYGVKNYAPIVRMPQACALAIGVAEDRVIPNEDPESEEIYQIEPMLSATLSCDHRVVDGAVSAQWLAAFRGLVENPLTMLL